MGGREGPTWPQGPGISRVWWVPGLQPWDLPPEHTSRHGTENSGTKKQNFPNRAHEPFRKYKYQNHFFLTPFPLEASLQPLPGHPSLFLQPTRFFEEPFLGLPRHHITRLSHPCPAGHMPSPHQAGLLAPAGLLGASPPLALCLCLVVNRCRSTPSCPPFCTPSEKSHLQPALSVLSCPSRLFLESTSYKANPFRCLTCLTLTWRNSPTATEIIGSFFPSESQAVCTLPSGGRF